MTDVEERFERLVREHGAALGRLAAAYARDAADRDDLLQEVLVAIWRALPRFRGDCSERTFVFRVAHNRGMTFAGRARRQEQRSVPDELPERHADGRPDPAAALVRAERYERLLAAVRRLAEPLRQAVVLHLEGLSNGEIAEVQGTTANNVAVRLTRARQSLRALLGGPGGDG